MKGSGSRCRRLGLAYPHRHSAPQSHGDVVGAIARELSQECKCGGLLPGPAFLRSLGAYPTERVLRLLKKSAHDTTSGCCLSKALRWRSVMPPQMPYSTLLSSASTPHS